MVGCKTNLKKRRRPEWLNSLLSSKFFVSCGDHINLRKNEKNIFCVDCNFAFCKHCMEDSESVSSPHRLHEWFQVCKYVYHDVIRLQDIQKHLDCSKIQTYKINGEKAIHLHPRPPSKGIKIAKLVKGGAFCEACGRHLQDLPNCFCSIQCKVSIMEIFKERNHEKSTIPASEFDDISSKHDAANEDQSIISESQSSIWWKSTRKPNKELHLHKRRKGVPHRAPLL